MVKEYLQGGKNGSFKNQSWLAIEWRMLELAENMAIRGINTDRCANWRHITGHRSLKILAVNARVAEVVRTTKKPTWVAVNLDETGGNKIDTGMGFFDHMLDQIMTHGGFQMNLTVKGDLHWWSPHGWRHGACARPSTEDALRRQTWHWIVGLSSLPMDECLAQCALDLSGRPYLKFDAKFSREQVVIFQLRWWFHFFRSLCRHTGFVTLHLSSAGNNDPPTSLRACLKRLAVLFAKQSKLKVTSYQAAKAL